MSTSSLLWTAGKHRVKTDRYLKLCSNVTHQVLFVGVAFRHMDQPGSAGRGRGRALTSSGRACGQGWVVIRFKTSCQPHVAVERGSGSKSNNMNNNNVLTTEASGNRDLAQSTPDDVNSYNTKTRETASTCHSLRHTAFLIDDRKDNNCTKLFSFSFT